MAESSVALAVPYASAGQAPKGRYRSDWGAKNDPVRHREEIKVPNQNTKSFTVFLIRQKGLQTTN